MFHFLVSEGQEVSQVKSGMEKKGAGPSGRPQVPTFKKFRDFTGKSRCSAFLEDLIAMGLHSHVTSLLMLCLAMTLARHCSPVSHQPHLLDPWRQWSLQLPLQRLFTDSGDCLAWPFLPYLRLKKPRPMQRDLFWVPRLIDGRGEPRAHCVSPWCLPVFIMLRCLHLILHKNHGQCQAAREWNLESNGSTFPIKLGRTNLWDGTTSSGMSTHYPVGSPEFSNNS